MSTRRLSSRPVYENRWLRLREDEIERPDGSRGVYSVVEKPDFALVVPIDADGGLWLVEQYRYPVSARFWEFPQGAWEDAPDADPLELARGELREEVGLQAAEMRHLGRLYHAYGFCSQAFDVWLAGDFEHVPTSRDAEEQDMQTRKVTRAEWEAMVRDGTVMDGPSIAAYGLLLLEER
jgi:8-oxo-dGTP pyrophosphatase MutT (NUDIX family)